MRNKGLNKKGIEVSFDWIFALVVGAIIIILAVYAAVKLVGSESKTSNTEIAAQLGVLLNPVEAGFVEGQVNHIDFPLKTKLFFSCDNKGDFGRQRISTSAEMKMNNLEQGLNVSFANKYIFAENMVEGKVLLTFSKGFNMPFKVSDVIFVWSADEKYCFVDPINEVKDELTDLRAANVNVNKTLFVVDDVKDCAKGSKIVCFDQEVRNCSIFVDTTVGSVRKGKYAKPVYYQGNLIYGAIFADPDVYECQIQRLMKKTSQMANIYLEKTRVSEGNGCGNAIMGDLTVYSERVKALTNSGELSQITDMAINLNDQNPGADECKLWRDEL